MHVLLLSLMNLPEYLMSLHFKSSEPSFIMKTDTELGDRSLSRAKLRSSADGGPPAGPPPSLPPTAESREGVGEPDRMLLIVKKKKKKREEKKE